MQMSVLWPFILATGAYAAYQVALKFARPDVNILLLLAFAYLVACVSALALWLANPGLGGSTLLPRDMFIAALIGISIVGIEFGFASAFRAGEPINTTGAIVNVATALLLVPIGYLVFAEQMSLVKLAGLGLCCAGLILLAWR
jgi:drug/metabolite transporter (DMT)-like permease